MSILDSAINYLSDAMTSVSDTVESWSQEWANAVENFKTKATQFVKEYDTLKTKSAIAEKDPETFAAYNDLMSNGSWIYNTVADIARKLDMIGNNTNTMNAMGVLPLIPIAIIVGAVAAMTAWIADAYLMTEKLNAIERLEKQGHDPIELTRALQNEGGLVNISGAPIQNLVLLGAGGLLLYLFWPKIIGALK